MNLFELFVKIGVDDQASGKLKDIGGKLGNGLATAAKIGTAAVTAAAAGITALTTAAVNNYAEYEQLVGGVDTLFKNSSKKIQKYASSAYKTAGLSANKYMETVTSFSASLLQSLGDDTEAAADYADKAITDMSDNANKMGTSMEMIQNAYQGFAKANYTMLDNLKLGYGGTKSEMQRLIANAAELSDTVDAQSMSFANIVEAIHVVQTEMGITGTTALEAGRTISGSVASMKSAWTNLVTGLGDANADIDVLLNNFLESVGTVAKNIVPVVVKIVKSILSTLESRAPELIAEGAVLLGKLAVGLIQSIPSLIAKIPQIIKEIVAEFRARSGEFSNIGRDIIAGIKSGISGAWNNLVSWFKGLFGDLIGIAKKILGIASPSKVFKKIGGFTAEGFGAGFEDEFAHVKDDVEKALTFEDASIGINTSVRKIDNGTAGTPYGIARGGVNVVQNIYSEAKTAADLMQEALYQQERAVLLGV